MIGEQRRKILSEPIKDTDIRPHVIAKSIFQKCTDRSEYLNIYNPCRTSKKLSFNPPKDILRKTGKKMF